MNTYFVMVDNLITGSIYVAKATKSATEAREHKKRLCGGLSSVWVEVWRDGKFIRSTEDQ